MSHEAAGKTDEWYTPKYVFDALNVEFDMDVAAPFEVEKLHVPTKRWVHTGSLDLNWEGFVWMNPPYGNQKLKMKWIDKFIQHGNGIALMPDRTYAPWWQHFARQSDAVLFVSGKIKFTRPDGSVGESPANGTTLFAIGEKGIQALLNAERATLGKMYINIKQYHWFQSTKTK